MIKLEFLPHRAALLAGQDNNLDVLLRVQGPAAPESRRDRLPLNLAIVIDRSGSMAGRAIAEAKRCAGMIVDRLSAKDRASLVVYDHVVNVLVPSQPAEDKKLFHAALQEFDSGGTTDLHAGWLAGAEQASHQMNGKVLSRVLLLSDGNANQGLCDVTAIAGHCAEMADAGVGTSTYGLGQSFNEDLMTAMARSGQGNAYYGRTADDLMDPFQQEFDLLDALCARRLRLALDPAAGVRVEVANGYKTDAEGRSMLPDLAYGGEAWALLRLTVPRSAVELANDGDTHLLTANLAYADLDDRTNHAEPVHLRLPRLPAAAFAAIAPNDLVTSRAAELNAAALQEQARSAALSGDWGQVQHLLEELRAEAAHSPWLRASIGELERYANSRESQRFSKEALYKASAMRSRLAALDEQEAWSNDLEAEKASFLRRKLEQGRRFEPSPGRKAPSPLPQGNPIHPQARAKPSAPPPPPPRPSKDQNRP
jgi:Ca-activated chloride channel family protein